NVGKVKERMSDAPLDSWELIFNPELLAKFKDCGIHMLDAPTEMIPAALNYLGKDPASQNPDEIKEAAALLEKIRPNIQKFHSSEYINALANGDICIAVGWSGDIFQARDRASEADNGVEIGYSIPKQGALMWFDQMAIPADAPNAEGAHKFIDFMLNAENIAKATNYVYYANGNKASQPLLEKDITGDPAIYPDADTLGRLYVVQPYPPKVQRVATRAWTKVKSGQ
ncbi:MAG: extracellular solute-binding protein, partial [Pseudomonadota bacterium]